VAVPLRFAAQILRFIARSTLAADQPYDGWPLRLLFSVKAARQHGKFNHDRKQTKRRGVETMRTTNGRAILISVFLLIASAGMFMAHGARAAAGPTNDGPTKENALEAEKELGQAMQTNDADGFCRLLDPDWAIVNGIGGFGDGAGVKDSICAAIKAGTFTRKTYDMDLANARVRVYGNIATVTFKLSLSGALNHKDFSGKEVQTDILKWEDGGWKCVLTHETNVRGTLVE
jgi:ketosteroid isomerase-like protein